MEKVAAPSAWAGRDSWAWRGGALLAVLVLGVVVATQWSASPLPGREQSDPVTNAIAALLTLLAQLCALACLGSLLRIVALTAPGRGSGGHPLDSTGLDVLRDARRWAQLWATTAAVLVLFNAAQTEGYSIWHALAAPGDFISSSQNAQAWLLTAVLALLVSAVCWSRAWRGAVLGSLLAVAAALPPVVTAHVSVGHGHDWATDLAVVLTVVATIWFALTWATSHTPPARDTDATPDDRGLLRHHRLAGFAVLIVLATRIPIGVFELAGEPFWASAYGVVLAALIAVLVGLGISWLVRAGILRRAPRSAGRTRTLVRSVRLDLVLVLAALGLQAALTHIPPPRFLRPQSGQINYLGFEVPDPPHLVTMLLPGRPNVLLTLVTVLAVVGYVWGVVRLRRRGDSWPVGRTVAWLLGWFVVLLLATTQIWQYSSVLFSWHMVMHMTLNMLVPVLLVLAGPITLLLRATTGAGRSGLAGPRDAVESLLAWPLVQRLTHPLVIWVVFVGSFYALYFSPLFGVAMKYHWAHQFMTFHFLIIGTLFYGLVAGVDRPARPLPHIARLGFVFAAMPFHAFFAVGVLSGTGVIGENYYNSLDLAWAVDLVADQQAGGSVAWATGELPLLIVIIALIAQWFRQDQRAARRQDRAFDAGHDDAEDAYNDMLAELARRDRERSLNQ